ncbi:MAG: potassium channel family protein [Rhodoluna sp.]
MSESQVPRRKRSFHSASVAVIGLGRFGSALALELVKGGHQVLGIDTDEKIVQNLANDLTNVVTADTTDEDTLRELGIAEMDSAVVAIGADLESSILTTSLLLQLGVKTVWAKANSVAHGKILHQLGTHKVIFPELEMGRRVAHQVSGESLDYVQIDEDFVMVKVECPESFDGKNLAELRIRAEHGVTVVATSHQGAGYQPAFPETVLHSGDVLVVAGRKKPLDVFCQLS